VDENVNAAAGPASRIFWLCVGTETESTPWLSLAHGSVFGFAVIGSTVSAFKRVTRAELARQPNGLEVAAEAVPAQASASSAAAIGTAIRRADAAVISLLLVGVLSKLTRSPLHQHPVRRNAQVLYATLMRFGVRLAQL
jgi:hypothetical protein